MRLGHIALFVIVSRDTPALRHAVLMFAGTTTVALGLLVGASFADGGVQVALWLAVIVIDWGGGLVGVEGWRLVPRHFAERHNLVIILALGESIVALGAGAHLDLTPR